MRIEASTAPPAIRRSYLASLPEPQELHVESLVQAGQTLTIHAEDDTIVGYGIVADATIVEFFVIADHLGAMPELFALLLSESGAHRSLCKTFDPLMLAASASQPATTTTTGFLFRDLRRRTVTLARAPRERGGSHDDIEAVWAIHDGFFDDRREIERYVSDGHLLPYEADDGAIVGCGVLTRTIPGSDALDVGMVVSPAHRRQGLGSYIVARLIDCCISAGDRPVAGCSSDNIGSRRALERAGFITAHSLIEFTYTE